MDYCTPVFGRRLNDLTYADIGTFFSTQQTETDQIEFKSFSPTLDQSVVNFTKTICGFLNSSGGILICGAPRATRLVGGEQVFVGNPLPWNQVIGHDEFVNRCVGQVTPLPNSIRAQMIEAPTGGCLYIVEVDASDYSPHQVRGGIYYMRIDGQTQPAPHHYVEALMRKVRFPHIEAFIKFNHISRAQGVRYQLTFELAIFNWSPLNNAKVVSYMLTASPGELAVNRNFQYRNPNAAGVLHFGAPMLYRDTILFEQPHLLATDGVLSVSVIFGAENSPLKSSDYELQFPTTIQPGPPDRFVINRHENVLFKDTQDARGISRESVLQEFLGRTP